MIIPTYLIDTRESKPIAKGKSQPATSGANSILSLPAEIRNLVYDALFHVPGGIRLVPHTDYHYLGSYQDYSVYQLFEDDDVGHALATGLPMLASCRQIYHEAVSTLISGNTWIIGRHSSSYVREYEIRMVSQVVGAARWLYSLDTLATLVRKVVIDLDKTCSSVCPIHWCSNAPPDQDCHGYQHAIRMLDLLRQLWRNPGLELGFVHPKGKAHADYHPGYVPGMLETGLDPKLLGAVTQALRDDQVGLAKYDSQMEEVWIQRDCKKGRVVFRLRKRRVGSPKRHFSISPDGKTLAWKHDTPPSLMSLPPDVRAKIFDRVSRSETFDDRYIRGTVAWDLDAKTVTGASDVLSAVCLEGRLHQTFWRENRHAFKIKTSQIEVNTEHLHSLCRFSEHYEPRLSSTWDATSHAKPLYEKYSQFEIIIEFDIHPGYMLEDLRINVAALLDAACTVRETTMVTILISDGRGGLRARATRSLSGIADEAYNASRYLAYGCRPEDQFGPAWIDGNLEIVRPPAPWTPVAKPERHSWERMAPIEFDWYTAWTGW